MQEVAWGNKERVENFNYITISKTKKILKEELVVDQVFCIKSVDELQTEAWRCGCGIQRHYYEKGI